jgi:NADH:ubiquinone oxidoreductase subunit F (NADH-binding)/NADH:ubiquinone oxidoreductase subunit E
VLAPFPRERQWLLPALRQVQETVGWLPEEVLAQVAAHLRVPASEVYGVATHYPELRLRPRGRHHVRVCTGVTCSLLGGRQLLAMLAERLGAKPGDWGADAPVSLESADCLFACSVGPVVEADDVLHGRLAGGDVDRVVAGFREPGHAVAPAAPPRASAAVPAGAGRSAGAALAALVAAAEDRPRAATRVLVQTGTCGRAVGAADVLHALRGEALRRGATIDVAEAGCSGACWAAPVVEVQRPGRERLALERVEPGATRAVLDLATSDDGDHGAAGLRGVVWGDERGRGLASAGAHPFWNAQTRVLLDRAGRVDPGRLDDVLRAGGYRALAAVLEAGPEAVIDAVKASGLQGRGGAFFPAAVKWEACRAAPGQPKYLVMNGEEGEPGIFKDRHLMEGDPHRVLEGVLLAAWASGVSRAILYVHGEAHLAAERLIHAVREAESAGLAGERILGSAFSCALEVRRGAGGFVLGEETALLESIEGRRAQPRTRPPFPVESGLWGRPTVINNVETLSAVPAIVERGGAWFAGLGTPRAPGTKLFGLSGPIARPGVVEMAGGVTLGRLVHDVGGGLREGGPLLGAVVGGPSGSVVPASLFDVPLEPRGRVSPGTGGVVAVPAGASVLDIVRTLVAFNAAESCGKCTPCREGLPRLLALLDELGGVADAGARVRALGETIQLASLCGLGQAAPLSVLGALDAFGGETGRGAA